MDLPSNDTFSILLVDEPSCVKDLCKNETLLEVNVLDRQRAEHFTTFLDTDI